MLLAPPVALDPEPDSKMTRYIRDFMGIPAAPTQAHGQDPNYAEYYRGMRMISRDGRAGYGAHRLVHQRDLETEGGFHGHYHDPQYRGGRDFDPRWEMIGGVEDAQTHARLLREFNASGPFYADPEQPGAYSEAVRRRGDHAPELWTPRGDFRPEYGNRGLTDAGYSEGWARGPMRGAR